MQLTKEQKSQMQRVFPQDYEESDIPAIWRSKKKPLLLIGLPCEPYRTDIEEDENYAEKEETTEHNERAIEELEAERFSSEYPLGNMVEPYDIEVEKEQ